MLLLDGLGVNPPIKRPRVPHKFLCSVVPDGGTKYPCVSNVVTPLSSVPPVKSLVSDGLSVATVGSPLAVAMGVDSTPAFDTAVTESGLLQQRILVPSIVSSA